MGTILLIVTLEDVRQGFGRDAMARIAYDDIHQMVVLRTSALHTYFYVALFGIFDGIRHQIIHDGAHDFLVVVHIDGIVWSDESEAYHRVARQFLVLQIDFLYRIDQVALFYP